MNDINIVRSQLSQGLEVVINPQADRTRKILVKGVIDEILTKVELHPHGILVKLKSGEIGRVKQLAEKSTLGQVPIQ